MPSLREGLLRTLSFHETWQHAPTRAEWVSTLEFDGSASHQEVYTVIDALLQERIVECHFGRFVFPALQTLIHVQRENEFFAARKYRTARRVAAWLARLGSVRFVALCNTTALGHARDEGDLDFFVITKKGTIMQTRALAALPFKLIGRRPGVGEERDAICLSYFISEDGLDLSSHMLKPDDVYFRYWFLSLLPLFDDGVSRAFWDANISITRRHPFAQPWQVTPDFRVSTPRIRLPLLRSMDSFAARLQAAAFPATIRNAMNQDTRVIITERALKFHVTDGRESYRASYEAALLSRGL